MQPFPHLDCGRPRFDPLPASIQESHRTFKALSLVSKQVRLETRAAISRCSEFVFEDTAQFLTFMYEAKAIHSAVGALRINLSYVGDWIMFGAPVEHKGCAILQSYKHRLLYHDIKVELLQSQVQRLRSFNIIVPKPSSTAGSLLKGDFEPWFKRWTNPELILPFTMDDGGYVDFKYEVEDGKYVSAAKVAGIGSDSASIDAAAEELEWLGDLAEAQFEDEDESEEGEDE